jgi:hypothetical protein
MSDMDRFLALFPVVGPLYIDVISATHREGSHY